MLNRNWLGLIKTKTDMKAEINNENKAKFFALYWGQRVFGCKHYEESILVTGHAIDYLSVSNCSDYYLELKPLSRISDDDAIESIMISLNSSPDKFEGETLEAVNFYRTSTSFQSNEADFLRSRGYALPWMGLSVEEMVEGGWIKLT